jgi:hypothetical protein
MLFVIIYGSPVAVNPALSDAPHRLQPLRRRLHLAEFGIG